MFSSTSWFTQCTCFASHEDETQMASDAAISVMDEDGRIVDLEESSSKEEGGGGEGNSTTTFLEAAEEVKEETKEEEVVTKEKAAPSKEGKKDIVVNLKELKRELKKGIPIKKHCSDGKIRKRHLILSEDGKRIGWKLSQKYDDMILLTSVDEIREATAVDPSTVGAPDHPNGMGGTETFRKTCDGLSVARRAFSLIMKQRTLDVEVDTELEARKLVKGFAVIVQKLKSKQATKAN